MEKGGKCFNFFAFLGSQQAALKLDNQETEHCMQCTPLSDKWDDMRE